jgi:hypothetical protein
LEDPHVDRHQAVIEASADAIAMALADIEYWLYAAGAIIVGSLFLYSPEGRLPRLSFFLLDKESKSLFLLGEPSLVMLLRQNHRQPRVNLPHQVVRLPCDDRAGVHPFIFCWISPAFPQPRKNERTIVVHLDRVRNFFA